MRRWMAAALVSTLGILGLATGGAVAQETTSPYNHVPLGNFFPKPKKQSLFKRFMTRLSIGVESDKEEAKPTLLNEQSKSVVNPLPGQTVGGFKPRSVK